MQDMVREMLWHLLTVSIAHRAKQSLLTLGEPLQRGLEIRGKFVACLTTRA